MKNLVFSVKEIHQTTNESYTINALFRYILDEMGRGHDGTLEITGNQTDILKGIDVFKNALISLDIIQIQKVSVNPTEHKKFNSSIRGMNYNYEITYYSFPLPVYDSTIKLNGTLFSALCKCENSLYPLEFDFATLRERGILVVFDE